MGKQKPITVDFEEAAEIFISIFPSATPAEVLEHAERGRRISIEHGDEQEAIVFGKVAAILRRRLAN